MLYKTANILEDKTISWQIMISRQDSHAILNGIMALVAIPLIDIHLNSFSETK